MADISINNQTSEGDITTFDLTVEGREFTVQLSDRYYQQLTDGQITREQLVRKSFEFLLEREPVTAILSEFDLPTIQKYFPEYEEEIATGNLE